MKEETNQGAGSPENPSAFPHPGLLPHFAGMTLRDYFAAKMGAAIMGHEAGTNTITFEASKNDEAVADRLSKVSYCIADAFLRARAVTP